MPALGQRRSAVERFWEHVQTSDDCWIWMGCRLNTGYGELRVRQSNGTYRGVLAHRFAYELLIGPIPTDLELDHIGCDMPACVNPAHLAPVTHKANVLRSKTLPAAINARKTHCKRGHKFTSESVYPPRAGVLRACRICQKIRNDARRSEHV